MNKCGQCRQFTRQLNQTQKVKGLCGAWEQPTLATRTACDFFMPKNKLKSQPIHQ